MVVPHSHGISPFWGTWHSSLTDTGNIKQFIRPNSLRVRGRSCWVGYFDTPRSFNMEETVVSCQSWIELEELSQGKAPGMDIHSWSECLSRVPAALLQWTPVPREPHAVMTEEQWLSIVVFIHDVQLKELSSFPSSTTLNGRNYCLKRQMRTLIDQLVWLCLKRLKLLSVVFFVRR